MKIDIHQHHWSEPLLAALSRRGTPPYARVVDGEWELHLAGEAPSRLTERDLHIDERAKSLAEDGFDAAVIGISSPAGIEDLPVSESRSLIDAHLEGMRGLPGIFRHWAVVSVWNPRVDDLAEQLDKGAVGLQFPAGALASPAGFARVAPLLELLELRGAPLFVHPGPGPYSGLAVGEPAHDWWPALTRYVAEMNAAWHAFVAVGRAHHRDLKIVFAMLAGLAPLHAERLVARGGPMGAAFDPLAFYDVSSYGPRAIAHVATAVGEQQLVYGSDAPVIDRAELPAVVDAANVFERNPERLLGSGVAL